jgi:hypothetical protein
VKYAGSFGGSPRIDAREERFNAPERALPPTWALALATGLPTAKAACEFTLFRWTEVQLPLLKQGAPA